MNTAVSSRHDQRGTIQSDPVRRHVAERARWEMPHRAIRFTREESRERKEMRNGTGEGRETEYTGDKSKARAASEGADKRDNEHDHRCDIDAHNSEVQLDGYMISRSFDQSPRIYRQNHIWEHWDKIRPPSGVPARRAPQGFRSRFPDKTRTLGGAALHSHEQRSPDIAQAARTDNLTSRAVPLRAQILRRRSP
jgi:hypothetical protein